MRQRLVLIDHRLGFGDEKEDKKLLEVKSAHNILEYRIGQYLSEKEVREMIMTGIIVDLVKKLGGRVE